MNKSYNSDLYTLSYQMKKKRRMNIIRRILKCLILFVAINAVITFLIFPVKQYSDSMSPDIPRKSTLFVTPIIPQIKRGDVLLVDKNSLLNSVNKKIANKVINFFTLQQKGLYSDTEHLSSKKVLRRVIGLPGDTVYMKDFIIYIKPAGQKYFLSEFELTDKKYNIEVYNLPKDWDDSVGIKAEFSPVTLESSEYFVLADNRFSSLDSRVWGVISKKDVVGKAMFLYFPFNKIRLF